MTRVSYPALKGVPAIEKCTLLLPVGGGGGWEIEGTEPTMGTRAKILEEGGEERRKREERKSECRTTDRNLRRRSNVYGRRPRHGALEERCDEQ